MPLLLLINPFAASAASGIADLGAVELAAVRDGTAAPNPRICVGRIGGLQEALLAQGDARAAVRAGDRTCADNLLRLENDAREASRGLWVDPNFAPLAAEPGTWTQEKVLSLS
jgi:endonuclease YncB( thermonuclease family)